MKRIICTEQSGCTQGGHILAVGVSEGGDKVDRGRWTVSEVYAAMDAGEWFYTYAGGKVATVNKFKCPCGRGSLRTAADATTANNLDSLRLCSWAA